MSRPDTCTEDALRKSPAMRRARLYVVLAAYSVLIPLGAWAIMLVAGAAGDNLGYPPALALTGVGVFAWHGVESLYRFIRDGVQ